MPRLRVRLLRYGLLAPLSALIATALHGTPPTWAGGAIDNKASNPLNWALGNLTLSVAPGNSDQVVVSTGTVLFDANTTYGALTFSGGNLNGSSTLTLGSLASSNWSGGNMTFSSGGGVAVSTGATLAISGASTDHDFSATALTNSGTVNWTGGRLRSGNGGTFTNNGVFNDTASSTVNNDLGGTALVFSNGAGAQYNKNAAGTTEFDIALNNSGSVNVSSGELYLHAGGSSSGTFTVTGAGNDIRIDNGYTFNAGTTLSGLVRFGGGTITANGNIVANGLSIEGGSLQGSQAFSGGTISWTGGDWNETGASTSLASSTTLGIGGTSNHDFSGRAISNYGTVNWSAGQLRSGNGGSFTNYANFNDSTATSTDINSALGGATATFTNSGDATFSKSGSGTTRFYDVTFNNSGTVNVHAGTLELHGGGTNAALATIAADAGASVVISNDYTLANGSSLTGAGNFSVTGGTLTANGNVNVTNLTLSGGALAGTQTFNGGVTWSAGNLNSSGTTTIGGDSTFTVTSDASHDFNGRAIVNSGIVNWTGGTLQSGNGGTLTNNGTFVDAASSGVSSPDGGASLVFNNSAGATYRKTAVGDTNFYVPLVNSGTLDIQAGNLVLNADSTLNDGTTVTGGGALKLLNGTLTANGVMTFANFVIAGGTVSGTHTFNGSTEWSAGNFNSSGSITTIGATATMTIDGSVDHDFSAHNFSNNGTVNWSAGAGRLRSGDAGQFVNNGTFNDAASNRWNNDLGGTAAQFFNGTSGTYNKTAEGTTTFDTVSFTNAGTINVQAGTLELGGGGSSPTGAHFNAASGTTLRFTGGNFAVADGSALAGAGSFVIAGGTVSIGTTVKAADFELTGGTLDGNQTFSGGLTWSGGDMNNSGTTAIGSGGTMSVTGTADHDFNGHGIVNNGTFSWASGAGWLRGGNGATLVNNGTFNDNASSTINNDAEGTSLVFTNSFGATYNKLAAGNTDFFIPLNNDGTMSVGAGSVVLHSGGTFGAGAIFSGVGTTQLASGTFTAKGAIQTSNLVLAGGTLSGNSLLHGLFEFASGLLGSGATTTVDSDGAMTIDSTADHDLPGSSLINNGVIKWNGGTIRGGDAASITNNGTFIDYASSEINNYYGGTLLTFTNSASGVYAKAGAGTTTVGIPFTNNGTLAITAGTMVFNGTFTNNGSLIFANGGIAQIANPISFPTGATLAGNGTLNISSVIAGGLVSPGTSPGQLNVSGDLTLLSTSLLLIELGGTTQGTTYDFLNVGGNVTLGGNLSIQFTNGFSYSVLPTNVFTVLTANGTGGLSGAFANVANGQRLLTTDGLGSFQVNYGAGLNSVTLTNFVAVPEPSTYALLGFGMATLSVAAWRRKRKA